jgi:hypothetical protein
VVNRAGSDICARPPDPDCLEDLWLAVPRAQRRAAADAWFEATPRERNAARRVVRKNQEATAILIGAQAVLFWALIVCAMPAVVLSRYYKVQAYTEAVCNSTRDIMYAPGCKFLQRAPCGRATATVVSGPYGAGQTVRLRYPNIDHLFETWSMTEFRGWLSTIQQPNFTCFVRDSGGTTAGVTGRALKGSLHWWHFMAGLAGAMGAAYVGLMAFGSVLKFQSAAARREVQREHPQIAMFLGENWLPQHLPLPHVSREVAARAVDERDNFAERMAALREARSGAPHADVSTIV